MNFHPSTVMNSHWIPIQVFPLQSLSVTRFLTQCVLNSATQSRTAPACRFLGPLLHSSIQNCCWRSEMEVWEPPTWEENLLKLRQAENLSIFEVLVGTEAKKLGVRSEIKVLQCKFRRRFVLKMSTFVFTGMWEAHAYACENLLRFFCWYWVSTRQKPWSNVQNSWVSFLVLLLSLDLSFDFSVSLSFKWGEMWLTLLISCAVLQKGKVN